MEKRKLGFSDLEFTTIGLGTWAMGGGDWFWGWGPQDDKESIETIQKAIDEEGINWIDTAAAYGLGRSEELIAKALKGRRNGVLIATKCGLVWEDDGSGNVSGRLKAESVRKEAEDSLRRLDVDVIDLYQIHWPDPDEDIEEAWGTIADLIAEGKVRYGGVSNFSVEQMKRVQSIHPIASLQPEYSLLKREPEGELLNFCLENDIGVIAYSPLRSGILTGKFDQARLARLSEGDWRRRDPDFQEPQFTINMDFMAKLEKIAERFSRPVAQLAIAWAISQPITAAIVGARKPSQIKESAPAADWILTEDLLNEINDLSQEREQKIRNAALVFNN